MWQVTNQLCTDLVSHVSREKWVTSVVVLIFFTAFAAATWQAQFYDCDVGTIAWEHVFTYPAVRHTKPQRKSPTVTFFED